MKKLYRTGRWLAGGGLLFVSCIGGTGQFVASAAQPALAQVLSELASAITAALLGGGM